MNIIGALGAIASLITILAFFFNVPKVKITTKKFVIILSLVFLVVFLVMSISDNNKDDSSNDRPDSISTGESSYEKDDSSNDQPDSIPTGEGPYEVVSADGNISISDVTNDQLVPNNKLIGTWSGVYIIEDVERNVDLTITDYSNNIVYAIFSFSSPKSDDSKSGSFFMHGSLSDNNLIHLVGDQWISRPDGYFFVEVNGILNESGTTIIDDALNLIVEKQSENIGDIPQRKIISDEGYLSNLSPYRMTDVNGYMKNNDFDTFKGEGYVNGYVATSGGISYEHVISVCSYSPFKMMYNLEGEYTKMRGKVGFDDISVSGTEFLGLTSEFQGKAEIIFRSGDTELKKIELSVSDLPKEFELSVSNIEQLIICVEFPYYNFVFENFNKYFNFIDVELN